MLLRCFGLSCGCLWYVVSNIRLVSVVYGDGIGFGLIMYVYAADGIMFGSSMLVYVSASHGIMFGSSKLVYVSAGYGIIIG